MQGSSLVHVMNIAGPKKKDRKRRLGEKWCEL
jgi:hypothetical protein